MLIVCAQRQVRRPALNDSEGMLLAAVREQALAELLMSAHGLSSESQATMAEEPANGPEVRIFLFLIDLRLILCLLRMFVMLLGRILLPNVRRQFSGPPTHHIARFPLVI